MRPAPRTFVSWHCSGTRGPAMLALNGVLQTEPSAPSLARGQLTGARWPPAVPPPASPPVLSLCRRGVCSISSASYLGSPAVCTTCVSCVALACGTVATYPLWSARATTQGRRAVPTGARWRRLRPSPPENASGAQRRLGKASASADRLGWAPCAGRGLRGPHQGPQACGTGWRGQGTRKEMPLGNTKGTFSW